MLRRRLRELAQARPRFGYLRRHVLRRGGWVINRKRVHRLYRKEGLIVRLTSPRPSQENERWSMDFVADTLLDGRHFRALTVVENWSRLRSLIEVDFTLTGRRVVAALDAWAYAHEVKLDFIRPGKPVENAEIESFNGKFRNECLNANVFISLHDAR